MRATSPCLPVTLPGSYVVGGEAVERVMIFGQKDKKYADGRNSAAKQLERPQTLRKVSAREKRGKERVKERRR